MYRIQTDDTATVAALTLAACGKKRIRRSTRLPRVQPELIRWRSLGRLPREAGRTRTSSLFSMKRTRVIARLELWL